MPPGLTLECRVTAVPNRTLWEEEPPHPSEAWGNDLKQTCPPDFSGWGGDEVNSLLACPGNSLSLPGLAGGISLNWPFSDALCITDSLTLLV